MTREEAIQILSTRDAHGVLCGYTSGYQEALDMAIEVLKADAVPFDIQLQSTREVLDQFAEDRVKVVRCKDCRFYEQKQKNMPYNVRKRYCNRSVVLATKENDFCSYGERREE